MATAMSLLLHLFLFTSLIFSQLIATAYSFRQVIQAQDPLPHFKNPNQCSTSKCGNFQIPFPFYLNATSCPTLSDAFRLYCVNSSSLFLNIASESYRVLQFFPDGLLVDFPNTSMCRQYNDLKSFSFSGNEYFGISTDNVLDLYDCEDSSLCKADCEKTSLMPGCEGQASGYPSCCYPLSDRSAWRPGDSLSEFSQFGCRGFSSWIVLPGSRIGKRGVKLEWAVPRNSTEATCAANADLLNATSVASGIRCQCPTDFSVMGSLSELDASNDGKEAHGHDCYRRNNHGRKKAIILAVVIISAVTVVCLTALCLSKRPIRPDKFVSDQSHCQSAILSQKACRSRLFTYHELVEATKGFEDGQKIVDGAKTTLYAGVLMGGSHHLIRARDQKIPLDWYRRLNVAAETACVLAFLHHEISPPIFHHDLQTGCIFLDADFSVKLAGFELHNTDHEDIYHPSEMFEGSHCMKNDVYSLGVVLLEIITGNTMVNYSTIALQKIKNGKLEEIVDPSLYYHEQPPFRREQIEIIADLATRCLLFGADGKLEKYLMAHDLELVGPKTRPKYLGWPTRKTRPRSRPT
ncbi:UNVERIFIED_CONTAM: putative inactive receptor-like protein kinase [Sesamum radiatum]|uniref:Inactive receptor-like protein kinase n=1 Tax=Sesamum radiatum TaxID=300843 RepID=A0AAW2R1S9_SESRA